MAEPHPQAGLGNAPRTAGQPQIAQRQAPIGEKNLNPSAPRVVEQRSVEIPTKPAPKDDDADRSESDWGLAPTKPGLTRENKFILFVLLVLVAVFSFVVFRNFQKKKDAPDAGQVAAKDDKSKDKKTAEKSAKAEPKHLAEPADESSDTPTLAEADSGTATTEDPFGGGATADIEAKSNTKGPPKQAADGFGQEPEETTVASDGPPDQIGGAGDAPVQDGFDASSEPAQTATVATNRPNHHRGRGVRGQPASLETNVEAPAELPPDFGDEATAPTQLDQEAEPVNVSDFTQTGGTAAEPIGKRAGVAVKDEFAQAATTEVGDTGETLTPTTPNATNPRTTSPRSATTPRHATAPRTHQTNTAVAPVPPLDPNDVRLGGMHEADIAQSNRRPTAHGAAGHTDAQHQPLVANHGEYIVQPHDNYWRISRKVYGTARYYNALAKHNEQLVPDAKNMKPGLKISTPSEQQLEQAYRTLIPAPAPARPVSAIQSHPNAPKTKGYFVEPGGQPAYRVGNNESLSSIAHKTLGRSSRWDEIYELNKHHLVDADTLPTATVLLLPPDASQTRVVGKPIEHH